MPGARAADVSGGAGHENGRRHVVELYMPALRHNPRREGIPAHRKGPRPPVSRTPLAGAADQLRERSSTGGVRLLP